MKKAIFDSGENAFANELGNSQIETDFDGLGWFKEVSQKSPIASLNALDFDEVISLKQIDGQPGWRFHVFPPCYVDSKWHNETNGHLMSVKRREYYCNEKTITQIDSTHYEAMPHIKEPSGEYTFTLKIDGQVQDPSSYSINYATGEIVTDDPHVDLVGKVTCWYSVYSLFYDKGSDQKRFLEFGYYDRQKVVQYQTLLPMRNKDFQYWDSSTVPKIWTKQGTISQDTSDLKSGKKLIISQTGTGVAYIKQHFTLPTGTIDQATVFAVLKTNNCAYVKISLDDTNWASIPFIASSTSSGKWVGLAIESAIATSDDIYIQIDAGLTGNETSQVQVEWVDVFEGGLL